MHIIHGKWRINRPSLSTFPINIGTLAHAFQYNQDGLSSSLGVFMIWWLFHIEVWRAPSKARPFACLTILWIVWQERNARIFEEKWRTEENLWDLLHFNSYLWASCTVTFKGVPLNVIQLSWCSVCNSKGVDNFERFWVRSWGDLYMPMCMVLLVYPIKKKIVLLV